jgi:hypothetical protein
LRIRAGHAARRLAPHDGIGRRLRRINAHFAVLLMSALRERVPKALVVMVLLCAATALSIVDYLNDQQLSVALLFLGLVSFRHLVRLRPLGRSRLRGGRRRPGDRRVRPAGGLGAKDER